MGVSRSIGTRLTGRSVVPWMDEGEASTLKMPAFSAAKHTARDMGENEAAPLPEGAGSSYSSSTAVTAFSGMALSSGGTTFGGKVMYSIGVFVFSTRMFGYFASNYDEMLSGKANANHS